MFDISDYLKKSSKAILSLSKFEKEIKNICEEILKVKKNNNKGIDQLERAKMYYNKEAIERLIDIYLNGRYGIPRDVEKAKQLLKELNLNKSEFS